MITLAQAQTLTQDKLYLGVIDELRRDKLLEIMVFDNAAQLSGGSTLNYVYNKITKHSTAGFRAINGNYTDDETTTDTTTVRYGLSIGVIRIFLYSTFPFLRLLFIAVIKSPSSFAVFHLVLGGEYHIHRVVVDNIVPNCCFENHIQKRVRIVCGLTFTLLV